VGGPSHGTGSQFNDAMHVHFTPSFDAHHHILDPHEIAGRTLPDETVTNFPDRLPGGGDVAYPGPYDPSRGDHRLARSFRLVPGTTPPPLAPFAPSDLRIDGGYSERHSAPAYYLSLNGDFLWPDPSGTDWSGAVGFWVKPSFAPELSGKFRAILDMSRFHDT